MPQEQAGGPAEGALRARLAALEAENARLGRELQTARRDAARFRAMLASAADYAIFTTDPAGRVTSWNAGAENLLRWSEAEALGLDSRLLFTPEDRAAGIPEAEMALAAAEGRAGNERWHARKDGSRFWGSGLLVPLRDGSEQGFLKVMRDRTARREGDERQTLLLRELAHRVKNSLAMVLSMARQTGGRAADLTGFLEDFEGRIRALAAAHDLLSENGWLSVSLAALVRAALASHDDGRITVGVADQPLKPAAAQSLVMVMHELATNATKHGALAAGAGTVSLEARPEGDELVLAWREAGGRAVVPPRGRGFGTTLLEQVVAFQHQGRIGFDWRPEGLACTIRLPLAEVTARTGIPGEGG
jgi:PAS domain S-box-containing protein